VLSGLSIGQDAREGNCCGIIGKRKEYPTRRVLGRYSTAGGGAAITLGKLGWGTETSIPGHKRKGCR